MARTEGATANRHDAPIAYDPTDKTLFRVPPKLAKDDPEYARIDEWCRTGRYICGADDCEDRSLRVQATYFRYDGTEPVSAHFTHRGAAHHGIRGQRAYPGESTFHLAAKQYARHLGESYGHRAEIEVFTSDPDSLMARRPDVVWTPDDGSVPWAVEVQFAPIPTWQWKERTSELKALGYRPLWLWGVRSTGLLGSTSFTAAGKWSDRYTEPSEVWVIEVGTGEAGLADFDTVGVAQCVSFDLWWESMRAVTGRRPAWPGAVEYDLSLAVEFDQVRGLRCPERDAAFATLEIEAAAGRLDVPDVPASERNDNRDFTVPSIIARTVLPRPTDAPALSPRGEKCGGCGVPLFCCPSTVRRFVRCCDDCSHRTQVDLDYEQQHPDYAEFYGAIVPSDQTSTTRSNND